MHRGEAEEFRRTGRRFGFRERVIDAVPHGHWKTTTLTAALNDSGVRCSMTLDGAVNLLAFEAFVEQALIPVPRPGDLVVMDNLSSHKGERTPKLIREAKAELVYLPPYSADLIPIELAFSKIKQARRSLSPRTVELSRNTMPSGRSESPLPMPRAAWVIAATGRA